VEKGELCAFEAGGARWLRKAVAGISQGSGPDQTCFWGWFLGKNRPAPPRISTTMATTYMNTDTNTQDNATNAIPVSIRYALSCAAIDIEVELFTWERDLIDLVSRVRAGRMTHDRAVETALATMPTWPDFFPSLSARRRDALDRLVAEGVEPNPGPDGDEIGPAGAPQRKPDAAAGGLAPKQVPKPPAKKGMITAMQPPRTVTAAKAAAPHELKKAYRHYGKQKQRAVVDASAKAPTADIPAVQPSAPAVAAAASDARLVRSRSERAACDPATTILRSMAEATTFAIRLEGDGVRVDIDDFAIGVPKAAFVAMFGLDRATTILPPVQLYGVFNEYGNEQIAIDDIPDVADLSQLGIRDESMLKRLIGLPLAKGGNASLVREAVADAVDRLNPDDPTTAILDEAHFEAAIGGCNMSEVRGFREALGTALDRCSDKTARATVEVFKGEVFGEADAVAFVEQLAGGTIPRKYWDLMEAKDPMPNVVATKPERPSGGQPSKIATAGELAPHISGVRAALTMGEWQCAAKIRRLGYKYKLKVGDLVDYFAARKIPVSVLAKVRAFGQPKQSIPTFAACAASILVSSDAGLDKDELLQRACRASSLFSGTTFEATRTGEMNVAAAQEKLVASGDRRGVRALQVLLMIGGVEWNPGPQDHVYEDEEGGNPRVEQSAVVIHPEVADMALPRAKLPAAVSAAAAKALSAQKLFTTAPPHAQVNTIDLRKADASAPWGKNPQRTLAQVDSSPQLGAQFVSAFGDLIRGRKISGGGNYFRSVGSKSGDPMADFAEYAQRYSPVGATDRASRTYEAAMAIAKKVGGTEGRDLEKLAANMHASDLAEQRSDNVSDGVTKIARQLYVKTILGGTADLDARKEFMRRAGESLKLSDADRDYWGRVLMGGTGVAKTPEDQLATGYRVGIPGLESLGGVDVQGRGHVLGATFNPGDIDPGGAMAKWVPEVAPVGAGMRAAEDALAGREPKISDITGAARALGGPGGSSLGSRLAMGLARSELGGAGAAKIAGAVGQGLAPMRPTVGEEAPARLEASDAFVTAADVAKMLSALLRDEGAAKSQAEAIRKEESDVESQIRRLARVADPATVRAFLAEFSRIVGQGGVARRPGTFNEYGNEQRKTGIRSRALILALLAIGGVEKNPGPPLEGRWPASWLGWLRDHGWAPADPLPQSSPAAPGTASRYFAVMAAKCSRKGADFVFIPDLVGQAALGDLTMLASPGRCYPVGGGIAAQMKPAMDVTSLCMIIDSVSFPDKEIEYVCPFAVVELPGYKSKAPVPVLAPGLFLRRTYDAVTSDNPESFESLPPRIPLGGADPLLGIDAMAALIANLANPDADFLYTFCFRTAMGCVDTLGGLQSGLTLTTLASNTYDVSEGTTGFSPADSGFWQSTEGDPSDHLFLIMNMEQYLDPAYSWITGGTVEIEGETYNISPLACSASVSVGGAPYDARNDPQTVLLSMFASSCIHGTYAYYRAALNWTESEGLLHLRYFPGYTVPRLANFTPEVGPTIIPVIIPSANPGQVMAVLNGEQYVCMASGGPTQAILNSASLLNQNYKTFRTQSVLGDLQTYWNRLGCGETFSQSLLQAIALHTHAYSAVGVMAETETFPEVGAVEYQLLDALAEGSVLNDLVVDARGFRLANRGVRLPMVTFNEAKVWVLLQMSMLKVSKATAVAVPATGFPILTTMSTILAARATVTAFRGASMGLTPEGWNNPPPTIVPFLDSYWQNGLFGDDELAEGMCAAYFGEALPSGTFDWAYVERPLAQNWQAMNPSILTHWPTFFHPFILHGVAEMAPPGCPLWGGEWEDRNAITAHPLEWRPRMQFRTGNVTGYAPGSALIFDSRSENSEEALNMFAFPDSAKVAYQQMMAWWPISLDDHPFISALRLSTAGAQAPLSEARVKLHTPKGTVVASLAAGLSPLFSAYTDNVWLPTPQVFPNYGWDDEVYNNWFVWEFPIVGSNVGRALQTTAGNPYGWYCTTTLSYTLSTFSSTTSVLPGSAVLSALRLSSVISKGADVRAQANTIVSGVTAEAYISRGDSSAMTDTPSNPAVAAAGLPV
jgi:hypothetical protein